LKILTRTRNEKVGKFRSGEETFDSMWETRRWLLLPKVMKLDGRLGENEVEQDKRVTNFHLELDRFGKRLDTFPLVLLRILDSCESRKVLCVPK
jgi:hypothetical protein